MEPHFSCWDTPRRRYLQTFCSRPPLQATSMPLTSPSCGTSKGTGSQHGTCLKVCSASIGSRLANLGISRGVPPAASAVLLPTGTISADQGKTYKNTVFCCKKSVKRPWLCHEKRVLKPSSKQLFLQSFHPDPFKVLTSSSCRTSLQHNVHFLGFRSF